MGPSRGEPFVGPSSMYRPVETWGWPKDGAKIDEGWPVEGV